MDTNHRLREELVTFFELILFEQQLTKPTQQVKCILWQDQLCPTQMADWAKNHVTISTRAAHFM